MSHLIKPFSAEFQADPYPTYRLLRETDPVHCASALGYRFWVLTRYRDVTAALRDPRLSAKAASGSLLPRAVCEGNLFFMDPPEHTRLRSLINKAFLQKEVESLRPRIEALVDEVIDDALRRERERGHFDVVHEIGMPLSLGTISSILGLPAADRERLKVWTDKLAVLLDATRILPGLPAAHQASSEIVDYFRAAIAERRCPFRARAQDGKEPTRDLLCDLITAHDAGDRLTDGELVATSMFTLMAGHETVTSAISSGLLALYRHPEELARLRSDPSLAASAFDEMLRYDPPGQLTTKVATEDLVISGRQIRKGQAVVAVLAAANRDPEQFCDPERFDIGRQDNRHLSFSHGPHYCVGAALARLQGQILLTRLLQRLPALHIDVSQAVRKPGIVLRGLSELPARSQPSRMAA